MADFASSELTPEEDLNLEYQRIIKRKRPAARTSAFDINLEKNKTEEGADLFDEESSATSKSYTNLESTAHCTTETSSQAFNICNISSSQTNNNQILNMLAEVRREMKQMFKELTGNIVQLRKEVRSLKLDRKEPFDKDIVLPFPTLDKLLWFEKEIQEDQQKFEELQKAFVQRGSTDPSKFIKDCLKMMFRDEIAKEFSWLGTKNKKSARELRIMKAIKNAFHEKFPNTPEEIFDRATMRHFHYASDRISKKAKYQEAPALK